MEKGLYTTLEFEHNSSVEKARRHKKPPKFIEHTEILDEYTILQTAGEWLNESRFETDELVAVWSRNNLTTFKYRSW